MNNKNKKIINTVFAIVVVLLCAFTLFVTSDLSDDREKNFTSSNDIVKQDESEIVSDVENIFNKPADEEENAKSHDENDMKNNKVENELKDKSSIAADDSDMNTTSSDILSFSPPVYGKVLNNFSGNIPVYNKTLSDWRCHNGIDIFCEPDSEIYCSADGTVDKSYYDTNYGYVLEIKSNDYVCIYAGLSEKLILSVGTDVKTGQIVGYSADKVPCESSDNSHLHFEIKKNDEYVDPNNYITLE